MQTKILTISIPYTFIRGGYFYFSRRVPRDVEKHYSYLRVVLGLRTSSPQRARSLARAASTNLEAYWAQLRLADRSVPGLALVRSSSKKIQESPDVISKASPDFFSSSCPTLSDALEFYLRLKGNSRAKTFVAAGHRNIGYVVEAIGNKPLDQYSRRDALQLRDWFLARGMSGSTVTRNFSYIRAVVNFAISEHALDIRNPFTGVYYDRSAGVKERQPIPLTDLKRVQRQCRLMDDDLRWLIALVSDTGMRLAEATGLLKDDFKDLNGPAPHVVIQRHPWRRLKTASSERLVPLTGMALWAARRAVSTVESSPFAFPRYNKTSTTSADTASAALNKWLRPYVPEGRTMHSFRHSMRDRLRAFECPTEVADQIGGWSPSGIGQSYGSGYPLEVLRTWLDRATST